MDIEKMTHDMNELPRANGHRDYNGLSGIGAKCHRKLQYDHYWAYTQEITNRIQRIFDTGHRAEDFMIADLLKEDWVTANEQQEIIGTAGHWKGHIDGMIQRGDELGLLEMKTHNDKSFKEVTRSGVLKAKEGHYGQMQAYMGYLELDWALYIAYNKNTSAYYLERVPFDGPHFRELQRKEVEVIASDVLLPRIGTGKSTWFECKLCNANKVCYGDEKVEMNCRTCKNVDVLEKGKWECTYHNTGLTSPAQRVGCGDWELAEIFE